MDICKILTNQFGIQGKIEAHLLQEGSDNSSFRISILGENRYVLRVSKRLTNLNYKFEYEILKQLSQRDAPVGSIINVQIIKRKVFVLFQFIAGKHVLINKDTKPDLNKAKLAGHTLETIHNIGQKITIPVSPSRDIFTELNKVVVNKTRFIQLFENGNDFVKTVEDYINWGKKQKDIIGLIHNDYRPGNIFFENNKPIVIDFDWSCVGPLTKDIALGAVEWSFPDGAAEYWQEVFEAFIFGYNSKATIKIDINAHLYKWAAFACLSDASTYFSDLMLEEESKLPLRSYMLKKFKFFDSMSIT